MGIYLLTRLFQFSVPNKGDCNVKSNCLGCENNVSILSPQQRGLQLSKPAVKRSEFLVSILSPQQRGLQYDSTLEIAFTDTGFNSQSPTKGTAMG